MKYVVTCVTLLTLVVSMPVEAAFALSIEERLDKLEQVIMQQQEKIESQSATIEELRGQLDALASSGESQPCTVKVAGKTKNVVNSRNDQISVELYGQMNRGVLVADDGERTRVYQVDNDASSSRIGIHAKAKKKGVLVGALLEMEMESNATRKVNQEDRTGTGGTFKDRHAFLYVESEKYGKLSLGHTFTASDNVSEFDISGTSLAGNAAVANQAGGLFFYDDKSKALSSVKVSSAFDDIDGLGRNDVIRYDTPSWNGLKLATSAVSGGGGDIGLYFGTKNDQLKIVAAAAYANPGSNSSKIEERVNGSVSVLLSSGLSLTVAGGEQQLKTANRKDPSFCYAKLGYKSTFFDSGDTAFSIDYGIYDDQAAEDDEGEVFGAQLVQHFKEWSTEFFMGYRHYSLDRRGVDFQDINALISGLRVKF